MSIRRFARYSILSGVALAGALAGAGAANADVFLKVSAMPGEATQRGFEGQILVSGAMFNISSFEMPDPEGSIDETTRTTTVSPIIVTKSPDRASPKLMALAVDGAPLGTIEITFTSPGRPGQPQVVTSRWIIEGAEVRSFNIYPDTMNGNAPQENIEIGFSSMKYQYFTKDAKGVPTGAMEEITWRVPDDQLFPFDAGCR